MPKIDLFFKVFFIGILATLGFGLVVDAISFTLTPDYFWYFEYENKEFLPLDSAYFTFMLNSLSKFLWIGVLVGYIFGMAALMPDVDSKRLKLIYKSIGVVFLAIALLFGVSMPFMDSYWNAACCNENLSMKFVDGVQLFVQDKAKVGILAGLGHYLLFLIKHDYHKRFQWGENRA